MNNASEKYLYTPTNNKSADQLNVWMAFPGPESFAMSSLGYLWLFKQLDEQPEINAERINTETTSTLTLPKDVDMIGFSYSFDTDFVNIFSILDKYKIPFRSEKRSDGFPIIFAGGPVVTANPTPYEAFFDFFIIGDGEVLNNKVVELYKSKLNKDKFLKELSNIEGIYVPKYKKNIVKRTEKLSKCIYTPIISSGSYFPNTFIVEIARGCANRCGFCLASYINLPLRCVPYEEIVTSIDLGLLHTDKIALLGAQLSAHPDFEKICEYIYQKSKNENRNIEMSISSLRIDAVTPKIIKILSALGQKNITLAIEAGSDRLRKLINKNISKEQLFNAINIAKSAGLKGFKLYGMIGIPTETQEDINELISLAKEIKTRYKGFDISFGFSTFVPKPHTPFQWCGREDLKSLEKKGQYLEKELRKIGIPATVSSPKWDYWQAVLSRGDNSFAEFLELIYKNGGKLGAYKQAAKTLKIDADKYAYKNILTEETLSWDFINMKPGKDFLIKEHKRLLT